MGALTFEEAGGTTTEKADFVPLALLLPVATPVVVDWCVVKSMCELGNDKGTDLVFCCWVLNDAGETAILIIFFLLGDSGLLAVEIADTM